MSESKYREILREASSLDTIESKAKKQSAVLTTVIISLLFLILFFAVIPPQNPPFEAAPGGMDIILGTDAIGSGSMDVTGGMKAAATASPTPPAPPQPAPQASPVENDPDAPELTKAKPVKTVAPVVKPVAKTTPASIAAPTLPTPAPPARKADPGSMFPGNHKGGLGTGGGNGQGNSATPGYQGSPHGSPNGSLDGNGGSGGGPGKGNGDGFNWDLAGRNKLAIPIPQDNSQLSGKVVVEIGVDRDGNVVQARGGVKGSTTLDQTLITKAENAARKAKFTKSPNAADIQYGHITYNFGLN